MVDPEFRFFVPVPKSLGLDDHPARGDFTGEVAFPIDDCFGHHVVISCGNPVAALRCPGDQKGGRGSALRICAALPWVATMRPASMAWLRSAAVDEPAPISRNTAGPPDLKRHGSRPQESQVNPPRRRYDEICLGRVFLLPSSVILLHEFPL